MVLHKHGEYLYTQVQMILQKRSELLLERSGGAFFSCAPNLAFGSRSGRMLLK
jgi:hypothetical protein